MPQYKSIEKLSNVPKKYSPWEEAIAEAKQHIKELKDAIKVFEKHRDAGDDWPGFRRTAGTAKQSVPAKG